MPDPPKMREWVDAASEGLGDLAKLGRRPWDDIRDFELFPGTPLGGPRIVVPEVFLYGRSLRTGERTIEPRSTIPPSWPEAVVELREQAVRRCLLALWLPHRHGTYHRAYKATSWLGACRRVLKMARWQAERAEEPTSVIFSGMSAETTRAMLDGLCGTPRIRVDFEQTLTILAEAGRRGFLADFPPPLDPFKTDGEKEEPSRKGSEIPEVASRPAVKTYQSFPEEFVSKILSRSQWVQRNLGLQILDCWERSQAYQKRLPKDWLGRAKLVKTHSWRDAAGDVVDKLPFEVVVTGRPSAAWPPNPRYLNVWLATLQAMNLMVLAFCTGARLSELGSGDGNSLVRSEDGHAFFRARTFKGNNEIGGRVRDWPIPNAAVKALEIQLEIARRLGPPDVPNLWVKGGSEAAWGDRLNDLTEASVAAVKFLGLADIAVSALATREKAAFPDGKGERAHLHRWRHTAAKLAALTLVGAPQVLMDLFGHKNLAMTLRYMLSDPALGEEAKRVASEFMVATAQQAIEETLAGKASGAAATALRRGLSAEGESLSQPVRSGESRDGTASAMRRGEERFDSQKLRELAEILTFHGDEWRLVRPGVLCTKTADQFGPCTQGWGRPDAGACRTTCTHRLETAAAREQCRASLVALLDEHALAVAERCEMVAHHLEGQIVANLKRWEDVRTEILETVESARAIWTRAGA